MLKAALGRMTTATAALSRRVTTTPLHRRRHLGTTRPFVTNPTHPPQRRHAALTMMARLHRFGATSWGSTTTGIQDGGRVALSSSSAAAAAAAASGEAGGVKNGDDADADADADKTTTPAGGGGSAHRGPSVKRTNGPGVRRTADPSSTSSSSSSSSTSSGSGATSGGGGGGGGASASASDREFHGRKRVKKYVRHTTAKATDGAAPTRFPFEHDSFDFDGYATDVPELTAAFTSLISEDRLARLDAVVEQRSFDLMPILEAGHAAPFPSLSPPARQHD